MPASNLHISGLTKRYGDFVALAPTRLDVAPGEFLTLLGPSGSGKTTLLSLIAGLTLPDSGSLAINGKDVTHGAPHERDIGMVFQNYALFPHMTVAENIAFPLQMRKVSASEARKRVAKALDVVHLPHVAGRYPRELSGGQQQRIALARCMVYEPSIILMDEPLGALDKKLRDSMQLEIKRIHRDLGTTIVYVTHDQEEAMTMSDRICLMNGGEIAQLGTPADLYFRPNSIFVADFLGESNLISATVADRTGDDVTLQLPSGVSAVAKAYDARVTAGKDVKLMVRPQNLHVGQQGAAPDGTAPAMVGEVTDIVVTGCMTKLYMKTGFGERDAIVASFPTQSTGPTFEVSQRLGLSWSNQNAIAIAE